MCWFSIGTLSNKMHKVSHFIEVNVSNASCLHKLLTSIYYALYAVNELFSRHTEFHKIGCAFISIFRIYKTMPTRKCYYPTIGVRTFFCTLIRNCITMWTDLYSQVNSIIKWNNSVSSTFTEKNVEFIRVDSERWLG